ncbi:hypothetical protein U9M48_033603 [Paspalum notatum var. saurae]|uniref:FLZ-type domain-containing protein n=1 Tax=Paspalum notatum var. saurae TaxID=547442 RepID=A0AAQ3U8Q3_PASNO
MAAFFLDTEQAGVPSLQLLDACALCARTLRRDADIFMYRGDTPFCSEDCRDEQMQLDAMRGRQAARSADRRHQYSSSATESRRGHQETRKVSAVAS